MGDDLTPEEIERNRTDPRLGDPVQQLALHAAHWIEAALARHPERRAEIDRLSARLDEATGERLSREGDQPEWPTRSVTDGEIVRALRDIVAVMREVATLLLDPARSH
jgi:hypothetical protein